MPGFLESWAAYNFNKLLGLNYYLLWNITYKIFVNIKWI